MDTLKARYAAYSDLYSQLWEKRDRRIDDWPLMSSPIPTVILCALFVYVVKVAGPRYMKYREPLQIKSFLIVYNLFQIIFNTLLFSFAMANGWFGDYSFRCQPVDYTDNPKAVNMATLSWLYYVSKLIDFVDTFCLVARKKFAHISVLHVVHHGMLPLSVWPGLRFVPGGHATFFMLLNTFVHMVMYVYYFLAALGPQYQKYLWWKQHMTNIQMLQFVAIMAHGFQLIFQDDCAFPWQYAYYIAAHGVLFFILFSHFYIKAYFTTNKKKSVQQNGVMKDSKKSK